jgi:hypothetical protein
MSYGEHPDFSAEQIEEIRRMCSQTWRVLDELKNETRVPTHRDALLHRLSLVESIQEALR